MEISRLKSPLSDKMINVFKQTNNQLGEWSKNLTKLDMNWNLFFKKYQQTENLSKLNEKLELKIKIE